MPKKVIMAEFQDIRFATRALKEIKSLERMGYRLEFLAYDQTIDKKNVIVRDGVKYRLFPNRYWAKRRKTIDRVLRFWGGIQVILRMTFSLVFHNADIYHVHDIKLLIGGFFASLLHRGKLVYDAHELHMAKKSSKSFGNRLNYWLEKAVFPHVDLCIHASNERAEFVRRLYGVKKPLVLENFALKNWKHTPANLRHLCGLRGEEKLLLYVGNIVPFVLHRVEKVVSALPRMDASIHFCLVGPVNDRNRLSLESLAQSLNVASRVHIQPPVPSWQVISLISTADVSVIPMEPINLNQEFAALNKLSEACMAGLPVIVTDVPVLFRQVYENPVGPIGVAYQKDSETSFVEAVHKCFDPSAAKVYSSNAKLLAEHYYNWENEEKKLKEAYEEL
ncbi:glycosyltransferase [candidate division KSB1 bacterium]|nr:glycosyltransferase [candidate division KSB1 bacterium]